MNICCHRMASVIKAGLLLLALLLPGAVVCAEEYLSQQDFLAQAFAGHPPKASSLWLKPEQKAVAERIFGHAYQGLRVRYWQAAASSAWILEEVGKERPIRVGVIIDGEQIRQVSILAFEESRGWEVRYPFFTDQFARISLSDDQRLSKNIDGITGATLSVRAVTGVARWALYLNGLVHSPLQTAQESSPASAAATN